MSTAYFQREMKDNKKSE
uniref:Uncharacterized protein n=1 Tax=Anguilla anguilla TaxID=7936 RepID=A0A0E9STE1_ANGAN